MRKAVFIDRDGVVNSDEGHYYVHKIEDFVFNPEIEIALKLLKDEGFLLVMITNQGGVAKGKYLVEDIETLHAYMQEKLYEKSASFDAIYYCPHHDSIADCDCRKPKPGMILKAAKELDISLIDSYLIGDSDRDIQAGKTAGVKKCIKVEKNTSILEVCKEIVIVDKL